MLLPLAFNLTEFLCFPSLRAVRGRIQAIIADTFGLDLKLMYLTKPTFFSRINSTTAKTQHDEYWHPHIDKVRGRTLLFPKHLESYYFFCVGGLHYSDVYWAYSSGVTTLMRFDSDWKVKSELTFTYKVLKLWFSSMSRITAMYDQN